MDWLKRIFEAFLPKGDSEDSAVVEEQGEQIQSDHSNFALDHLATFDSDLPIGAGTKKDRLGFGPVASNLASSIREQVANQGLVVSIEGVWGSGKSSLVGLISSELQLETAPPVQVVRFEPWLVGDRDGMLVELMSDLASAVEAVGHLGDARGRKVDPAKLGVQIREYAAKLSRQAAPLAKLAGVLGVPGGELAGKVLEATVDATEMPEMAKPMPQIKKELTEGLRVFAQRIVVIIDDLDRLEPVEAAEIMRLVRAVADFPNVVYILCYDPNVLGASLKTALSIDDGAPFLEKIVQVRFSVPQPEAFDLRRWLMEDCLALYAQVSQSEMNESQLTRLQTVCDVEGSLLETPRDVVRVLNALRLYWPPISGKVDFPDLVWLQMIRIQNEELYHWVERYLVVCTAIEEGATIYENERIKFAEELCRYAIFGSIGSARSLWTLKDMLPGIRAGDDVEKKDLLFNIERGAGYSQFEKERRIGSPHHSRFYFAFSKPAGALEDSDLQHFIHLAKSGGDLESFCLQLIDASRSQGGTKFDVLVDRIGRMEPDSLGEYAIASILEVLSNCMDAAGSRSQSSVLGVRGVWIAAMRFLEMALPALPKGERDVTIRRMFESGRAIGWLMSEVVRHEIFAHGRYGDKKTQKSEWILTDEELDHAIDVLLRRFRTTDRHLIVETPEVLSLVYGWLQAGDVEGVQEWIREQSKSDAGFLNLLETLRGWRYSDKLYRPLSRKDINHFMDFDHMLNRLKEIKEGDECSPVERTKAAQLLEAAKHDEDW